MKLADVADPNRAPLAVIVVPPNAFADEWASKPAAEVAIGLRLISDADLQAARSEAAKQAIRWYEGEDGESIDADAEIEAFNDGLIRHAVARGACDPNSIAIPWFGAAAEDTVRVALTPEGVVFLWHELLKLHLAKTPRHPAATDDEAKHLGRLLQRGIALRALAPNVATEIRKLVAHCHETLSALDQGAAVADEDDDEDDTPTYVTRSATA